MEREIEQARVEAMWRELRMLRALLAAVMDVEKAEPTGDPYDPASWASAAKSVVAGSEHERVCAERDSLRASLTRAEARWSALVENRDAWSEAARAAVAKVEEQFDIEVVSINHHARWVDICDAAEARATRAEAERDALLTLHSAYADLEPDAVMRHVRNSIDAQTRVISRESGAQGHTTTKAEKNDPDVVRGPDGSNVVKVKYKATGEE